MINGLLDWNWKVVGLGCHCSGHIGTILCVDGAATGVVMVTEMIVERESVKYSDLSSSFGFRSVAAVCNSSAIDPVGTIYPGVNNNNKSCFSASLSHFNGSVRYSYTSLLSHPTSSRTSNMCF